VRRPREVSKTFAQRTWPVTVRDPVNVGAREQVYEPTKLAAVFDALVERGFSAGEILQDVNIRPDAVHSPKTRISLNQLVTAYQNAARLLTDRHLPYCIGTNIHVSTYGMYGYAILCCPDFRKAMDFAMSYHALAAPLASIALAQANLTTVSASS
jgi:Arabinose-binding domain of AraC transcription regulator, N-term